LRQRTCLKAAKVFRFRYGAVNTSSQAAIATLVEKHKIGTKVAWEGHIQIFMCYYEGIDLVGAEIANSKSKVSTWLRINSLRCPTAVTPRVALQWQRIQGRCERNECNKYSDQHHVSF